MSINQTQRVKKKPFKTFSLKTEHTINVQNVAMDASNRFNDRKIIVGPNSVL